MEGLECGECGTEGGGSEGKVRGEELLETNHGELHSREVFEKSSCVLSLVEVASSGGMEVKH